MIAEQHADEAARPVGDPAVVARDEAYWRRVAANYRVLLLVGGCFAHISGDARTCRFAASPTCPASRIRT